MTKNKVVEIINFKTPFYKYKYVLVIFKTPYKFSFELMHKQKSYLEKTAVHFRADKLYTVLSMLDALLNLLLTLLKFNLTPEN